MQLPQAWSLPQKPTQDSKSVFLLQSSLTGGSIAAEQSCSPRIAVARAIDKLNAIANDLADGSTNIDFSSADMHMSCSLAYGT